MRVLRAPLSLWISMAWLLLAGVIMAAQVAVFRGESWPRWPWASMLKAASFSWVYIGLFWFLILRGNLWARWPLAVGAVAWTLVNLVLITRHANFWPEVMALVIAGYTAVGFFLVKREMERVWFDPQLEWFEGWPRLIPGLVCELLHPEKGVLKLRVSRLDRTGAFLFPMRPSLPLDEWKNSASIKLKFAGREACCGAMAITELTRVRGMGVKFTFESLDSRRELGDMVEAVQGVGYA